MEKRAKEEQRKQQATAEASSNRTAEHAKMGKALHANDMIQHIVDITRNVALEVGATEDGAKAARGSAYTIAMVRIYPTLMQA